jgi:hypothetical protein
MGGKSIITVMGELPELKESIEQHMKKLTEDSRELLHDSLLHVT